MSYLPHVETTSVAPQLNGWAHDVYNEKIFLGPQQSASNLDALRAKNVIAIVNCTIRYPHNFEDDITYCRIAVSDEAEANLLAWLDGATTFMHHHIHNNSSQHPQGSVLVHCQMGMSRSATVVIAYLMKYCAMTLEQAFSHCKSRRPLICPNEGFCYQLQLYEQRLRNNNEPIAHGTSMAAITLDQAWAERSNVKYQTLKHIFLEESDASELFLDVLSLSPEKVLTVALDYLFGRGCVDLEWFAALHRALIDTQDILEKLLLEGESPILDLWTGDVSQTDIDRIRTACGLLDC